MEPLIPICKFEKYSLMISRISIEIVDEKKYLSSNINTKQIKKKIKNPQVERFHQLYSMLPWNGIYFHWNNIDQLW